MNRITSRCWRIPTITGRRIELVVLHRFCSEISLTLAKFGFPKFIQGIMKDTVLYEHLLGLKTPWSVKSVDLSLADRRVVVEVVLKKSQAWADPTDATKRAHVNGWTERRSGPACLNNLPRIRRDFPL